MTLVIRLGHKGKDIEMNSSTICFMVVRRYATLPSFVGLALALFGLPAWQWFIGPAVEAFVAPVTFVLLGQAVQWLLALSVLAISVYWARAPLASLGLRPLTWRTVAAGIGLGIVLWVALPLLAVLANAMFPTSGGETIQSNSAKGPAWLWLLIVPTAGVVEEVLFRAYAFERLASLTGSPWLAAILSLGAFVAIHLSWSIAHVVGVVVPGGALFMALYAWRRNLLLNILVHVVLDLPLMLIAAGILPPL
jgi:membrane protease YdiL (CAAX protease family)